ncbi:MAG: class I SAM-dependent methyltransferase [Variovorax sp.]|nr:class I SAM-dependent methyltransferase [Variovorax sp.]
MDTRQDRFEQLYEKQDDPYQLKTRWYEARKRAILLATLPNPRYARAFEPACGIGELTNALAARCDELVASDFSSQALCMAAERNRDFAHVRFERQVLPQDWPRSPGGFDLIVISEVGYFLDEEEMTAVARHCGETLDPNGTLVACDWRPAFEGRTLSAERVHEILGSLALSRIARYEDADFLLTVWARNSLSVTQHEGIRARTPEGRR